MFRTLRSGWAGARHRLSPHYPELGDLGGRSPTKLSGDYVATDNGVVPDGKTSEVGKMDSFPDGLVVKRNARVVPLSGDEGMSHPEGMSSGGGGGGCH